MPKMSVLYSPLCCACASLSRWSVAIDYGYEVEEISIAEVTEGTRPVTREVAKVIDGMKEQGGFLFAPVAVFEDGRAVPYWKVAAVLKEVHG